MDSQRLRTSIKSIGRLWPDLHRSRLLPALDDIRATAAKKQGVRQAPVDPWHFPYHHSTKSEQRGSHE